jgi:hypothetical protein
LVEAKAKGCCFRASLGSSVVSQMRAECTQAQIPATTRLWRNSKLPYVRSNVLLLLFNWIAGILLGADQHTSTSIMAYGGTSCQQTSYHGEYLHLLIVYVTSHLPPQCTSCDKSLLHVIARYQDIKVGIRFTGWVAGSASRRSIWTSHVKVDGRFQCQSMLPRRTHAHCRGILSGVCLSHTCTA